MEFKDVGAGTGNQEHLLRDTLAVKISYGNLVGLAFVDRQDPVLAN
jgi:hypothetical protein